MVESSASVEHILSAWHLHGNTVDMDDRESTHLPWGLSSALGAGPLVAGVPRGCFVVRTHSLQACVSAAGAWNRSRLGSVAALEAAEEREQAAAGAGDRPSSAKHTSIAMKEHTSMALA